LQELEAENQLRQAEHHYLEAKDWKAAINMYRNNDMWEECYRVGVTPLFSFIHIQFVPQVAKANGSKQAAQQVAYLWAKSLGGDSSVKLLTKFGLLESAIDYASENG
jgi:intraflagellar transport protein 172